MVTNGRFIIFNSIIAGQHSKTRLVEPLTYGAIDPFVFVKLWWWMYHENVHSTNQINIEKLRLKMHEILAKDDRYKPVLTTKEYKTLEKKQMYKFYPILICIPRYFRVHSK